MKFDKQAFAADSATVERKSVTISTFGTFYVKSLSLAENQAWESSVISDKTGKFRTDISVKASLLVLCAVYEDGSMVFDKSDIPMLSKAKTNLLSGPYAIAQKLNSISDEDMKELKGN